MTLFSDGTNVRVSGGIPIATGAQIATPTGAGKVAFYNINGGGVTGSYALSTKDPAGNIQAYQTQMVVNVKDYPFGAKGDGIHDDTAAIQAAINSLGSTGGDVFIPIGTYNISSQISITAANIRVRGGGLPGNATTFAPIANMQSAWRVAAGTCALENLFVYDTARHCKYGFLRDGDGGSTYDYCYAFYSQLDGIHANQIRNATIGTVTQTGSGSGTIPTVTVYASPSEGETYQILCTTGGTISGGGVAFTIELSGSPGTLVGPFTIPADGYYQFPHFVGYGNANGMLVEFPTAATYASSPQDAFSWTVSGPDDLNGTAIIRNCFMNGCGQIYGTPAFLTDNGYGFYPSNQKTSVSGTVLLTSGSQLVAGNGTSFLATLARPNDFIRTGTFPNWAASTTVPTGYLMTLGFLNGAPLTTTPGYAYVWEATIGGTTGSSPPVPTFPTLPSNNLSSGIGNQSPLGATCVDGGVTWTCVCSNIWQILRVAGNEEIYVNFHGQPGFAGSPALPAYFTTGLSVVNHTAGSGPLITLSGTPVAPHVVVVTITTTGSGTTAHFEYTLDGGSAVTGQTASAAYSLGSTGVVIDFVAGTYTASSDVYTFQIGVDYAILVGSGYYEDSSGNNNTCIFENNNFNENACCGMAMQPDYGHKIVGGQTTNNGAVGISTCVDGNAAENIVIDHVYMEGNLVCDHYLAGTFGIEIIQDVVQSPTAHVMNPGDESSGVWHGSVAGQAQDPQVESAFGSTYSSVPVTQSGQGVIFTLNGPYAKSSGIIGSLSASTPIDVSVATGVGKAIIKLQANSATIMTAVPLLANGVEGQEVVLLNVGNYPITFTGNTYPTAIMFTESSVTLGIGDSVELRCIVNVQGYPTVWYQTGPVAHGVCVNGGQVIGLTLTNGMNSAVAIRGRKQVETSGPTAAFQISGFIPVGSGDIGLGSGENGIPLRVINFLPYVMTLKHNDSVDESTAANRIWCPNGYDLVLAAPTTNSFSYVDLIYNVTQNRWIVQDYSPQQPAGLVAFTPTPTGLLIPYAAVNSQIFTTQIPSGTATGVAFNIPLPGYTGAPISTGMLEIDCETAMISSVYTGAARFKHTWQWSVQTGIAGLGAKPVGPLTTSLSVGNYSGGLPTGWGATLQINGTGGSAQLVMVTQSPSGPAQSVDAKISTQWGYTQ